MRVELEQARIKHIAFKSRLRSLLYGAEVEEGTLKSENECSLGIWIEKTGKPMFSHLPQMRELEQLHVHLHDIARRLIALYRSGREDEARAGLTEIEEAGNRLNKLLTSLEAELT